MTSVAPSTRRRRLPVEILESIFKQLDKRTLYHVLQANGFFYRIALRICYRNITILSPAQAIKLFVSLLQSDHLCLLVRRLGLSWTSASVTDDTYLMLNRVLARLNRLNQFLLYLPERDRGRSMAWIFNNCTFSLNLLETTILCDASLASFLDTQPEISVLTLHGVNLAVPFEPNRLPKISSLTTNVFAPTAFARIAGDKTFVHVFFNLEEHEDFSALDKLANSAGTMKTVSTMLSHKTCRLGLIREISRRFPNLDTLTLYPARDISMLILCDLAQEFKTFKSLRRLAIVGETVSFTPYESTTPTYWWVTACTTLTHVFFSGPVLWLKIGGYWDHTVDCVRTWPPWYLAKIPREMG